MITQLTYPQLPVTLAELKAHLRIEDDTEDTLLNTYIDVATYQCEVYSGRKFISAKFREVIEGDTYLNWGPFVSLESAVDSDNQPVTVEIKKGLRALAKPPQGEITIEYIAGYGTTPEMVPPTARQAVRILSGHYYYCREDSGAMPEAIQNLLNTVRVEVYY